MRITIDLGSKLLELLKQWLGVPNRLECTGRELPSRSISLTSKRRIAELEGTPASHRRTRPSKREFHSIEEAGPSKPSEEE